MKISFINSGDFDKNSIPQILYKYRNWNDEFDEKVLRNSELYFAPFKSFGYNSHEFEFEYDEELINDEELYKFFYDDAEKNQGITSPTIKHLYAIDWMKNTLFKNKIHRKKIINEHLDLLNENNGILSLTFDRDNHRLWKDFANDYSGYSVGVDKDFMFKNGIIDCIAGYVEYYKLEEKPKLLPPLSAENRAQNIFTRIFHLPDKFKNEEEYRLSKWVKGKNRTYPIEPELFKEIILGYKMCPENKEEIIQIAEINYPNTLILEQVYDGNSFDYKRISR